MTFSSDSTLTDLVQCPNCQYRITVQEVRYSRFDYACPRCGGRQLSDFEPVPSLRVPKPIAEEPGGLG